MDINVKITAETQAWGREGGETMDQSWADDNLTHYQCCYLRLDFHHNLMYLSCSKIITSVWAAEWIPLYLQTHTTPCRQLKFHFWWVMGLEAWGWCTCQWHTYVLCIYYICMCIWILINFVTLMLMEIRICLAWQVSCLYKNFHSE